MVQWRGRRRSSNIEDIRGQGAPRRMPGMKLGGGLGGVGLIIVVVMVLMGGDPSQLIGILLGGGQSGGSMPAPRSAPPTQSPADDEAAAYMGVILADTEDTWREVFAKSGSRYPEPTLTLFSDSVQSACGYNTAATGPFYCPPDQKLYLDLSFFQQLEALGAPGDFAQAYVIGHEVGHHVQNVTGILQRVQERKARLSQTDSNALQVLVELQADCLAGVWAHHAENQRDLLESGDVEEGLRAAASIGDDRLQQRAGRRVQPESFTHGSSAQRVEWFQNGMRYGDVNRCDTFSEAGVRL